MDKLYMGTALYKSTETSPAFNQTQTFKNLLDAERWCLHQISVGAARVTVGEVLFEYVPAYEGEHLIPRKVALS